MTGPRIPPAPDSGAPGDPIPSLARELDVVRRRVDTLAEATEGLPGRVEEIAGLVAKLTDALAAVTARRSPEPAPSWLLAPSDPDELHALVEELGSWLATVFLRYPDGAQVLPECWLWHPDAVEELLWLMHAWCAAYQGATASVGAAGDWHDRQRPGVVARLRKSVGSCSIERHQPRPGWSEVPSSPAEVPGLGHTGRIVGWWATGRDQPPPEPAGFPEASGGGLG
ncbi:hypothetical protein SAMN05216207_101226 [Pseudonocardia ammonioxydans]|uniref:DUF4913 domain-containing protein n=1 Tax=Pseudonocardia ammonioxydans TaxID=260086 RepID=A0A1I4XY12_PSUAM|nr:hypothetical protein [Pseudonocardia ammonioxydans]SFN30119.1 hypothetical protein SAMN05216207_101226 [Pseudonocardia ammonioxydans]